MRNIECSVCVLTKNGKPRRVNRTRADEIVSEGGKFISKTMFKVYSFTAKTGIVVPDKIFKVGDRAVKDFLVEATNKAQKAENKEKKNLQSTSDGKAKRRKRNEN